MNQQTIGFIGLGVMGEPMCRNLRTRGGNRVLAFDINPEPLRRLNEHGVATAGSAAQVVSESEVVFVSLPSGKELEALARGKDGLLEHARSGQIMIDLGTSPVALTRDLAVTFGAKGVAYLDAPVARTRQAAESGTLAVMVGGAAEVLEKVRPLMECFASEITHCGDIGSGQVTKILNNMVLFQTVVALSEAHAIAQGAGVEPVMLFDALSKGSADSFALRNHGMKAIIPRKFPGRAFPVEYAMKDLGYALELAKDGDVDAAGARNVRDVFEKAIEAGAGEQYFPVVSRILNGEI
ncbi:MAG: NAD(P)-dependent oxidoreductase [Betaproteobacteria bacterium]|nr:MAG: NAD(P)-dependent oxidoreductase [Betaproteobacteria bacterium]